MRVALVALLILGLAACGGRETVTVTEADSGRAIALAPGDTLEVRLESNATTGFRWNLDGDPAPTLRLVSSEYLEPDTDLVGAGGTEVWTFEAVEAGEATLELAYYRPFEPGDVGGRFELGVTIK